MHLPVICIVVGTRSEAIRVGPLVGSMRRDGRFDVVLIVGDQQSAPVLHALSTFDLTPDITLFTLTGPSGDSSARLMSTLQTTFADLNPAACVVQGDSMTAATAALSAFWKNIPVVHLEAGVRSGHLLHTTLEDGNRKIIDHISRLHLATSAGSAMNLVREGLTSETIVVTGNTVVDAIQNIASRDLPYTDSCLTEVEESGRRIVLLAVHREETQGKPLLRILQAMRRLIATEPTVHLVVPLNPHLQRGLKTGLSGIERVTLCEPLEQSDRTRLLANASLVLTDSTGIQEDAPSFDVPVLVLRDVTERPESVASGVALLVGSDAELIYREAVDVLAGEANWNTTGYVTNPFGDGRASQRTVEAIGWMLGMNERPEAFQPETADAVLRRPLLFRVA